jgi:Na+/proline symporter
MAGSLAAAFYALGRPEVGGLSGLLAHPAVQGKLSLLPDFSTPDVAVTLFVIPLAVQWWSVWYPGSEPGGGGYVAQRMLAAKDEGHAQGASLLFNVAHYALRPWPWILVALASLIVFPDLDSLRVAFPDVGAQIVQHDLAYAAMLTFLPAGLLGLVVASLMAAYMSTLSTHLNWGASYLVHDLYHRFLRPTAGDVELVRVGRLATIVLMLGAGLGALVLDNALQAFRILLQIGAGTGLLFMLRWFWWRINAASELVAMVVSFALAVYFEIFGGTLFGWATLGWHKLVAAVVVTTSAWIATALLTTSTDEETLERFYRQILPGGPGWNVVRRRAEANGPPLPAVRSNLTSGILCMLLGSLAVYSALFATGLVLYGRYSWAGLFVGLGGASAFVIRRLWVRL